MLPGEAALWRTMFVFLWKGQLGALAAGAVVYVGAVFILGTSHGQALLGGGVLFGGLSLAVAVVFGIFASRIISTRRTVARDRSRETPNAS